MCFFIADLWVRHFKVLPWAGTICIWRDQGPIKSNSVGCIVQMSLEGFSDLSSMRKRIRHFSTLKYALLSHTVSNTT